MQAPPITPEQDKAPGLDSPEPSSARFSSALGKWLREPLLHFLLAGALLFALYDALNPEPETAKDLARIELTKDDVRRLAVTWLAQGRSTLTPAQLQGLIEQKVAEEILAREAVALGLDRGDEIIKRRLAQKMDFLAVDLAGLEEPSAAELKDWFARNSERFAMPPRASFRHLYFSFDKRGAGARDAAAAALEQIAGGTNASPEPASLADPFMFQSYYGGNTPDQVAREFGPGFAKALFELAPGAWQGPVESGFGWHLVWIDSIEPGRTPAFEEIEPEVKAERLNERYREIKRKAVEEMRARYTVVVPEVDAALLLDLKIPRDRTSSSEASTQ